MTMIDILNKGAGVIIGAVTSLFIPVAQVAMAYYLFAQNMRTINPKQSWLTTILLTSTIGSVNALIAAATAIIQSPWSVMYGMREGFRDGAKGAVVLPYAIFGRVADSVKKDTPTLAQWNTSPVTYVFNMFYLSLLIGSYSIAELFIKPLEDKRNRGIKEKQEVEKKLRAENAALKNAIALQRSSEVKAEKRPTDLAQEASDTRMILSSKSTNESIEFVKAKLLDENTRSDFLLDAYDVTVEARLFLRDVCLGIAAMTKDQQDIIIKELATKANEFVLFRSNLESLKTIMERSNATNMFTNKGQIASIIANTLTMADQLKSVPSLSANTPSSPAK